jgi:hypothetical protein
MWIVDKWMYDVRSVVVSAVMRSRKWTVRTHGRLLLEMTQKDSA